MAIRAIILIADLPADGEPPEAIDDVQPNTLFIKRNGYDAVDLAIKTIADPLDVAVFRYNRDFKGWRAEGPRGTTPTTFDVAFPDDIPIRISVPFVEERLCIVTTTGDIDAVGSISEANR